MQAGEKADDQTRLLNESVLCKHGEPVVHVEPRFVRKLSEQSVHDAQEHATDALPPIGAEFGAEATDCVVVKLACVLEEEATLLVRANFHAFVRCFKVQGQTHKVAIWVLGQERACNVHACRQANVLRREAQGVGIAHCAV